MADVFANAGIVAAQIAGESEDMDIAAEELATLVRANAIGHGGFADTVHVAKVPGKHGVSDRIVYSDHEASFAIEHGHAIVRDGETLGYVPGIHAFSRALHEIPEAPDVSVD